MGSPEVRVAGNSTLAVFNTRIDPEEQIVAEEVIKSSFPPGCSWECYLANHPRLSKRIEHTEEAVLDQWINRNPRVRWDCTCKEGTMVEGNSETKMEEEDRQPAQMRG